MDIVIGKREDFEDMSKKLKLYFIAIDKNQEIKITSDLSEMNKKIDLIYGLEESRRNDFVHHRNSGLNHIMAKELSQKDIIVGFSFSSFLREGAKVIPRMKQNVKLCRKYDVKMVFASFAKNPYEMRSLLDLEAFARTIGMSSQEIKNSRKVIEDRIILNKKKRAGKIPVEGVEILD